ncbi:MAG: hypothetical protein AAF531_23885 [Actinomycetota bacterium]
MAVRPATEDDLEVIVQLSSGARDRLEITEPTFWRRHADADRNQRAWFDVLLGDDGHRILVSTDRDDTVDGFIVARAMDAPPVYDPRGRTCLVDDFVWSTGEVAEALIADVRQWATGQGCTQLVVITAARDLDRRELLERTGLHPTSEWWTGPL